MKHLPLVLRATAILASTFFLEAARSATITNPIPEKVAKGEITIELQTILDGSPAPIGMAVPDDGSERAFVYDQAGLVYVLVNSVRLTTPFLDIRSRLVRLTAYDERGLLGLAANPNFALHPFIYTYTSEPNAGVADFPSSVPAGTTNNHQSVIAEWRVYSGNSNLVDASSRREILRIDQPQDNNNGGTMRFGPDGFLYVALGDGGGTDDVGAGHAPGGNAQTITNILGGILRIDVDASTSANGRYGVPASNPFVGVAGVDELFAYGFRNPYGLSFDRLTGVLYASDVGQNNVEEVNVVTNGGNHGWNVKEGTFYFNPTNGLLSDIPLGPVPANVADPIAQYDHDDGTAIIGGFVYRGAAIPELQGHYVFGDWGSANNPGGRLFYLDSSNSVRELRIGPEDRPLGLWLKGFGEDASGELYVFGSKVLGPAGNTGKMLKILPKPSPIHIDSIVARGGNLTNGWTGGTGPFVAQTKPTLSDAVWNNFSVTTQRTVVLPKENELGFSRIADAAHNGPIPLTAYLSGLAMRPTPLTNSADGFAIFGLDGSTLSFEIRYTGLSGVATAAHIHGPATAATGAGVIINLAPFNGGSFGINGTLSGVVVLTPAQQAMILGGRTYVAVHTALNGGGEARGQIAPVLMQAVINGGNERPNPVVTPAHGSGTFALVSNQLSFVITYSGLSGPATAAHIHGPATASQSTNVMFDLAPFNGGAFGTSGSLTGSVTLIASQFAAVVDGLTYVNFHTALNPNGEMRGQVLQSTAVPLSAWLSGLAERPVPVTNGAAGQGLFSVEGNVLTFNIAYRGLSGPATTAHIHGPATTTNSAGVLVDLAPFNGGSFGSNGTISGSITLTAAQRARLMTGLTYVNLHTAANPDGELRGQIAPALMQSSLSGVNERPTAVTGLADGTGNVVLIWNQLSLAATYRGLSGPATAAHVHGPAGLLQAAGVIIDLSPYNGGAFGISGSFSGRTPLTIAQLFMLVDGQTYLNVHTVANSGGEIRGQISR